MSSIFTKTLDICQVGNPVLRLTAEPIADPQAEVVQKLIAGLIKTLKQSNGVGIAAPQVGRSQRLLVIASHPNARYPHAPNMEPLPLINPVIRSHSENTEKDWEGCLSVPGIRGLVPRYDSIEVEYCDRHGKTQTTTFTGFVARILQHEYDHLEGKVFLDRVESSLDLISEAEYLKLIQQGNKLS
ncbi:peptide deformylase [Synechococcus sp. PCC 7502]|uniref:peptide deformylase n=1 Tax=Synechococcus sp. PCC 7502 TaxID=1173263 RepID=UPI00029FC6C8|nr:peptide deformylase [Synechococcus sp. PCC 7502]AFY72342.1 peptide deformylase [Synechococcus sp. PCC 7502]